MKVLSSVDFVKVFKDCVELILEDELVTETWVVCVDTKVFPLLVVVKVFKESVEDIFEELLDTRIWLSCVVT